VSKVYHPPVTYTILIVQLIEQLLSSHGALLNLCSITGDVKNCPTLLIVSSVC